mgnify:CR=1 FL=1
MTLSQALLGQGLALKLRTARALLYRGFRNRSQCCLLLGLLGCLGLLLLDFLPKQLLPESSSLSGKILIYAIRE